MGVRRQQSVCAMSRASTGVHGGVHSGEIYEFFHRLAEKTAKYRGFFRESCFWLTIFR